jgi:hypothetical protein
MMPHRADQSAAEAMARLVANPEGGPSKESPDVPEPPEDGPRGEHLGHGLSGDANVPVSLVQGGLHRTEIITFRSLSYTRRSRRWWESDAAPGDPGEIPSRPVKGSPCSMTW